MSDKSHIEWTEATWNPVTGCTKVSQGCKHCYAERDWKRLSANPTAKAYFGRKFTDVQCHPERLDQPLRWRKPRRIFVNSMSDLFHPDVPDDFIDRVFAVMAMAPNHTFQVLTKRPERMRGHLSQDRRYNWAKAALRWMGEDPDPIFDSIHLGDRTLPNVWLGVSVEDQATADERIPPLLETPAAVRFLSCEPLLGAVDLTNIELLGGEYYLDALNRRTWRDIWNEYWSPEVTGVPLDESIADYEDETGGPYPPTDDAPTNLIDWVIAGGESGPGARPMGPNWVRSLRDQCVSAGVPFFFKQWGEWAPNCLCDTERAHPIVPRPDPHPTGLMFRCGKKRAGRLLDGRTWDEVPG